MPSEPQEMDIRIVQDADLPTDRDMARWEEARVGSTHDRDHHRGGCEIGCERCAIAQMLAVLLKLRAIPKVRR